MSSPNKTDMIGVYNQSWFPPGGPLAWAGDGIRFSSWHFDGGKAITLQNDYHAIAIFRIDAKWTI